MAQAIKKDRTKFPKWARKTLDIETNYIPDWICEDPLESQTWEVERAHAHVHRTAQYRTPALISPPTRSPARSPARVLAWPLDLPCR